MRRCAEGRIDHATAVDGLALLDVDELGLDELDRRVDGIIIKFGGGPVGLIRSPSVRKATPSWMW